MGWGDAPWNGNRQVALPNLEDMARHGLTLRRFYAASPVCSPTRGSVLTGRHPDRYGIFSANVGHLPPDEITLAELLRSAGYATGHFGKWHLGTLTRTEKDGNRGGPGGAAHFSPPQDAGFDVCFSTESKVPTWDSMRKPVRGERDTWWRPIDDAAGAKPYGTAYWDEAGRRVTRGLEGDDSRVIMDRVVPFVRGAVSTGRPFLAVIWFHAVHIPLVAGAEYAARYRQHDGHHQQYFGAMTAMDEQIGRLRRELRALDVADDTLLWFTSDNGPEGAPGAPGSAGPLRGRKRDLYEGGIRVPGVLEWPAKIKKARVTDVPAVTTDTMPTIIDALGLAYPTGRTLDGVSLMPLIEGRKVARPGSIGFKFGDALALVDGDRKLIRHPEGAPIGNGGGGKASGRWELYDLRADPAESRDLAAQMPETAEALRANLQSWLDSVAKSQSETATKAGDPRP